MLSIIFLACQATYKTAPPDSADPSTSEPSEPSAQPTSDTHSEPSTQPASEPSEPSAQPTSEPSTQPTSEPTSEPLPSYTGNYNVNPCDVTTTGYGIGQTAGDFGLTDQYGDTLYLSDFCGNALLLVSAAFW